MFFIGIVFVLIPAVSAGYVNAASSGKDKTTSGTNYNILPAGGSSLDDGNLRIYPLSTLTISTGVTKRTTLNIGSKVKSIEVDLKWAGSKNTLSLNILDPKGANLGTYYDGIDGKIDQRIHILVYPPSGTTYITQGAWIFSVKGDSVVGTIYPTIMFYTR